jgi:hypothetical protein
MIKQQRGVSFGGFISTLVVLLVVVLFGLKLIPAYIDDSKVRAVFQEIAQDPAMQKVSAREVRASFERRALVNWVDVIKSSEIVIEQDDAGRPILSANYSVKIQLAGNVSLLLEFNPTSAIK